MHLKDSAGKKFFGTIIAIVLALFLTPVFAIFSHFGETGRGMVVVCLTLVFCAVIYARNDIIFRRKIIATLALIYVFQLVVALVIYIPSRFSGIVAMPFALLDLILILWIVARVEGAAE